jgi:hypothetical protein
MSKIEELCSPPPPQKREREREREREKKRKERKKGFKMVFFPKYHDDDQITKGKTCSICSMCTCRLNWKSSEDKNPSTGRRIVCSENRE